MGYIRGMTTNRPFRQVDEKFGLRLGDEIRKRVKEKPNLTVCDIACGSQGTAISDLLAYHPQLKGIGLDYKLEEECETERLKLVSGDIFAIPFENVADVTYCAFLFADMTEWDGGRETSKIAQASYQIAKTLLPNGIAFVDEVAFASRQHHVDRLVEEIDRQNPGYSDRFKTTNHPDFGLIGNYLLIRRLR